MAPRTRLACAASLLLALAGCTTEDRPAGSTDDAASTPASSSDAPAGSASRERPLATTEVDRVPGGVDEVVRGRDGSTLVVLTNQSAQVSHYRIYDARWRPTTPAIRVAAMLDTVEATGRGFLARASSTTKGGAAPSYRGWAEIRPDGSLRQAARPPRLRPSWRRPRVAWYEQPDGGICAIVTARPAPEGELRTSVDRGRTWRVTRTAGLPTDAGSRLWTCAVAGDRVVVLSGGSEYPRMLHTFDRNTRVLMSNLPVGDGTAVDPYAWWLLPDGSLVARTDAPGVVVADDSSNATVTYRGGPVGPYSDVRILDDQVVQVRADRQLAVSDDRGATWRLIDLQLPAFFS